MSALARTCLRLVAAAALAALAGASLAADIANDEKSLYAAAQKEGKVVWYTGFPLEAMRRVSAEFEKKYPGVKIEMLRIVGLAQYQRFLQESQAGQHIADNLMHSDRPSLEDLIKNGYIAQWRVPTHDAYGEQYRLGTYAYSPFVASSAIAYNASKLTPAEIDLLRSDWKAILDPRFKGRVAVTNQKCGTCYGPLHMFLDPALQARYGRGFLEQVAQQKPVVYPDITVLVDRVAAGERDIAFWVSDATPYAAWSSGAPIRWLYPAPTPAWPVTWVAVSANAPHPNAARLFQNWQLSQEGALAFASNAGTNTSMNGVRDARASTKEAWFKPAVQTYAIDYARWDRNYDTDMSLWVTLLRDAK